MKINAADKYSFLGKNLLIPTFFLFLALQILSIKVMAQVNLIPEPTEIKLMSGFFKPDGYCLRNLEQYIETTIDRSLWDELGPEGYEISIQPDHTRLNAPSEAGIYYGMQSLKQLTSSDGIPCCTIKDKPRFSYRGIHLDVSRHFFSKEQIFKILNELARYKLNIFHFHLTDNGGWRIQIDKYPELTSQGAYRTQQDWHKWWDKKDRRYLAEGTTNAYGGYYTKDDIREIIAYAQERHITVIPEIEFPAHSDAVFAGYPELCCTGMPYTSGEFCVGNEKVYVFMEEVLSEIIDLFPSPYIHIGGDEARKIEWKNCPKCQNLIKEKGLGGIEGLQPYMINRIQDFIVSKGRIMIGWDEILHNELHPQSVVMSYRGQKGAIEAANKGNYAIMTPGEILYFDWYQKDPSTEPRAMYGYSPIKKMYSFYPVPSSITTALSNESMIQGKQANPDSTKWIKPENSNRILGIQGCCWTEYMEEKEQVEYMMFPRLLAISELAWSPEKKKNWPSFKKRMNAHIPALQSRGIAAFGLSNEVEITTHLDATSGKMTVTLDCEKDPVEIRYTLDGNTPTIKSALYTAPFQIENPVTVKAAVFLEDKIQAPAMERNISDKSEIRNFYPFIVPDVWKDGY
ncbi:MAG: family 20 glycosylhydrolase [Bacteroidales bacterium]